MNKEYTPPFKITSQVLSLVAEISNKLGQLSVLAALEKNITLRRINRIKTIQGSLAIEGNTLSEEQITAILEGKHVIAPPREIQEVRNAIKAYDEFHKWKAASQKDMLTAHGILMAGLVDTPGCFRARGVGVVSGKTVIHMAPPASRVQTLMDNLFEWFKKTDTHPLVKSSVFHYEFEFIHPFQDGNGRMGRLWQSLILSEWNPLFANLPVESIIHKHQTQYYEALNKSTQNAESSVFIEFILRIILDTMNQLPAPEVTPEVTPEVKKLLFALSGTMTRQQIQKKLKLKDEKNFRKKYQQPAINQGLIEMTVPDKPNSRLQKYKLTAKGIAFIQRIK